MKVVHNNIHIVLHTFDVCIRIHAKRTTSSVIKAQAARVTILATTITTRAGGSICMNMFPILFNLQHRLATLFELWRNTPRTRMSSRWRVWCSVVVNAVAHVVRDEKSDCNRPPSSILLRMGYVRRRYQRGKKLINPSCVNMSAMYW